MIQVIEIMYEEIDKMYRTDDPDSMEDLGMLLRQFDTEDQIKDIDIQIHLISEKQWNKYIGAE